MTNLAINKSSKIQNLSLIGFVILSVVLWNIPGGGIILYPFTLLGTWFHELAHGVTAIILGGDFHELVIFPNGSGYAKFSYSSLFLGSIGQSLVAAAGPVGPSLAGAAFVMSSVNVKTTRIVMYVFSFLLILSSAIWVRPIISWGFLVVLLFAVLITFIAAKGNDKTNTFSLQFLGVQSFLSVYQSIGYLFSSGANVGGSNSMSDTQVIAQNLFLPYWFWGALILALNIFMIYYSFSYYFRKIEKYN